MGSQWEMPIYGMTEVQIRWSSTKLRSVMRDKRYHRKARNYFYAELLRRRLKNRPRPTGAPPKEPR